MKIPYVEAKDSESDSVVKGFYFEFPETTYCVTEDYEREPKVKLIPCVMSHRMTDWGLPNVPIICKPIDKSTLKIIGHINTDNDYYMPTNYVIEKGNKPKKLKVLKSYDEECDANWCSCPNCAQGIGWDYQRHFNFCWECGTELDWE